MYIAFKRTVGTTSISMVMDESWDHLKPAMGEAWLIQHDFDEYGIWSRLVKGEIVTLGIDIFQLWDTTRRGEYADELFQGRYVEIVPGETP